MTIATPNPAAHRILVLVPCHNEEGRIGPIVSEIARVLPGATVAVINDDSQDSTAREARQAGATLLTHAVNLGYGAALETGYMYARQSGFDIVLQLDGDGQHPPEELPKILAPVLDGTADIVIGSRYMEARPTYRTTLLRRSGQRVFGCMVRWLTGQRITDPTSGFQTLGPRAIRLFSSGVFPCDYPDADVVTMAHLAGLRIREVPVTMLPRAGGKSMHSGLKPAYYAIRMFLSLFIVMLNVPVWRRWRRMLADIPVP